MTDDVSENVYTKYKLPTGAKLPVVLAHLQTVNTIWIRIKKCMNFIDEEEIMKRIEGLLDVEDVLFKVCSPIIGNIYRARFTKDGRLYRARVECLNPKDQTFEVFFVDLGYCGTCSKVYMLGEELSSFQPTVHCVRVLCNSGVDDTYHNRSLLERMLNEAECQVILKKDGVQYFGQLFFNGKEINLGTFSETNNNVVRLSSISAPGINGAPREKVGIPMGVEVKTVSTIHKVWVFRKNNIPALNEFMSKIDHVGKKRNLPILHTSDMGSICLARFTEDDSLYRGVIEEKIGNCLKVRYIDYGDSEYKKEDEIYEIPVELAIPPPFCFPVIITALSGCSDSQKNRERLYDLLIKGTVLLTMDSLASGDISVNGELVDSSLFLSTKSKEIIAVDSTKVHNNNVKAIPKNVKKPVQISSPLISKEGMKRLNLYMTSAGIFNKKLNNKKLEVIKLEETKIKVDGVEKPPVSKTQVQKERREETIPESTCALSLVLPTAGHEIPSSLGLSPDCKLQTEEKLSQFKCIAVPELQLAKQGIMKASFTSLDTVTSLWVTPVQYRDTLNTLMDQITSLATELKPIAECIVGAVGISRFRDGTYYRCKVLELDQCSKVQILYIDWGNSEWINSDDLFQIPVHLSNLQPLAINLRVKKLKLADSLENRASMREVCEAKGSITFKYRTVQGEIQCKLSPKLVDTLAKFCAAASCTNPARSAEITRENAETERL